MNKKDVSISVGNWKTTFSKKSINIATTAEFIEQCF